MLKLLPESALVYKEGGSLFELLPESAQVFMENINNFFTVCSDITFFIKNCFTVPGFLQLCLKSITPDILLIVLLALIILRWLGFKGTTKYISLSLVIAVIIAIL